MVQLPRREESSTEFVLPDEGTYTLVLDRLSEERPSKYEGKDGNHHPEQEFYLTMMAARQALTDAGFPTWEPPT